MDGWLDEWVNGMMVVLGGWMNGWIYGHTNSLILDGWID